MSFKTQAFIFVLITFFLTGCKSVTSIFNKVEVERTFYKNGALKCETRGSKGTKDTFQKCYFKSGTLKSETLVANEGVDKTTKIYWGQPKDQIKELKSRHPDLFDKKLNMLSLEAHEILENNEFCQSGERVKLEKVFKNDEVVQMKEYYCNGNVEYEEKYENSLIIESNTYYIDGKIKYSDKYENGVLVAGKVYDKKGNLLLNEKF